ncbi:MAG: hypothetical protein EPN21_08565 [Methylococcaceae bacterium]|nr:MAG: hypothetical protein EPN21_08565 [Methylococcaceae bacterium]
MPHPALLAGVILCILVAVLHGGALAGGWRYDDHYQLLAALRLDYFAALTDRAAWHGFSPIHYTPWLAWMYRFDAQLFGLQPAGHYLHLAASLFGVAWLTFYLLLPKLGKAWALSAAAAGIAAAPAWAAAQYLPGRHYVDGLLFVLLALLCQQRWAESDRLRWLVGSAVAGLLALMSKEIFLPLCVVLPWLGSFTWRRRLLLAAVHGTVCLGFLLWRSAMLGVFVGGYDHGLHFHAGLLYLPWYFLLAVAGDGVWGMAAALGFAALLAVWLWEQRAARWPALIITLSLMLPFLALSPDAATPFPLESPAGMRLFFVPGWLVWVTLALMGAHFHHAGRLRRYAAAGVGALFVLAAMQTSWRYAGILSDSLQAYDQQNAFIAAHGPADVLLPTGGMRYWAPNARDAQLNLFDRIPARFAAGWHDLPDDAARFWQYRAQCRCIQELPRSAVLAMPEFKAPTFRPLALGVTLQRVEHSVVYRLEPARAPAVFAVIGQGWPSLEVLPEGSFVITPPDNAFPLRFSRQVGANTAVSPPLYLPPENPAPVTWQRGIFVAAGAPGAPVIPVDLPQSRQCRLMQPATAELSLRVTEPLALSGNTAAAGDDPPTLILAGLAQGGQLRYLAPLYRLHEPGVDFGIEDADLSAVAPGDYALEILQLSPASEWRCATQRQLRLLSGVQ